jgi:hypothetical protein
MIEDNRIEANEAAGVRAGTYDGVGSIDQLSLVHNWIAKNRGPGVLLQANSAEGHGVRASIEANHFSANGEQGIAIGPNRISVDVRANSYDRNGLGAGVDYRSGVASPLAEE